MLPLLPFVHAVFVSPSLIAQTDAAVEETLHNSSWLDVATVLPPSLAPGDVAQLLDKCAVFTRDAEHKRGQVGLLGDDVLYVGKWRALFEAWLVLVQWTLLQDSLVTGRMLHYKALP